MLHYEIVSKTQNDQPVGCMPQVAMHL